MFTWSFIILSTVCSSVGQLILKHAMLRIAGAAETERPLILRMAFSPWVVSGLAVYGLGVLFWLMALSYLDVTVVYPFASLSYVGIIIGSYFVFKENISSTRLLGIGIIIIGVTIIGLSAGV